MRYDIKVTNKHRHGNKGAYIGRPSPLGNPFSHLSGKGQFHVKTRDEAVDRYRGWLHGQIALKNPSVLKELDRLFKMAQTGELRLVCFCAPARCHGDVVKEVLEEALGALEKAS